MSRECGWYGFELQRVVGCNKHLDGRRWRKLNEKQLPLVCEASTIDIMEINSCG